MSTEGTANDHSPTMEGGKTTIIIGAGVIGLQTAVTLLEAGYSVYVVAEWLPGDDEPRYTSPCMCGVMAPTSQNHDLTKPFIPAEHSHERFASGVHPVYSAMASSSAFSVEFIGPLGALSSAFSLASPRCIVAGLPMFDRRAGAQWRTHEKSLTEQGAWDLQTYRAWADLTERERAEGREGECGVTRLPAVHYWTHPPSTLWWTEYVSSYTLLPTSALPPGIKLGATFLTFAISTPTYLAYLLDRIKALGGRVHRSRLPTADGLPGAVRRAKEVCRLGDEKVWAVVNATGIGGRLMAQDEKVSPVRGQTVLVKGVANRLSIRVGERDDDVVAIMPRPREGTTIVGVTKEKGVWETEVSEQATKMLLAWGRELAPELVADGKDELEVLKAMVGLRPAREGGPRVEMEKVKGLEGMHLVHEYGHAGAGYQNSVGSANKVLKILREQKDSARSP